MLDTKALAEATALIVRDHVARATAPLIERIAALEARPAHVDPAVIERAVAAEVAKLPAAQDGKDVDQSQLAADVASAVERAVAALPAPRDGASVTVADLAPAVDEAVQRAVALLPVAKDGVGLAGALIDRHGALIVTLTDGTTRDLGAVVGKDADTSAVLRAVDEKVAALPAAADGVDGLGFDDLTVEQSGERSFVLRFTQGDRAKEFSFDVPVVIDRGVYKDGATYAAGDGVTWAGSYWIAQKETASKPDSGDGFRLAVKRGRDGKDLTARG